MFHFYSPWFALLFPLPFLFKRFIPDKKKNREQENRPVIRFPGVDRLTHIFPGGSSEKSRPDLFFTILFSLSWLCLILALMQPEKADRFVQTKNNGYDLMLAVDISGSMEAVDFSTRSKIVSRLDAAKEVVGKFVLNRSGDRVGLITFGENAYLYAPLTLDTVSVSRMLNDTVTGMAGNATAIGDAVGLAVKTLRERPEGSRVLVLLTDGENNAGSIPPLEAAKLAERYGIRIYTIGIGKNGIVPFPDGFGGYTQAKVSFDEDLLKKIAEMTGGQYFSATDRNALESIYDRIDHLEKTESNETVFIIREPYYYYPLSLSILFLLCMTLGDILTKRLKRYEF